MKINVTTRWILSSLYLLAGVTLILCGLFGVLGSFWSGLGTGLALVGALQMFRLIRFKNEEEEAAEEEQTRNRRAKAWSWTGYLYVLVAALATLLFKLLDNTTLMLAACGSMCIVVLLFWLCYWWLGRKK